MDTLCAGEPYNLRETLCDLCIAWISEQSLPAIGLVLLTTIVDTCM
eukprot:COSAG01_NODE_1642_length_9641_cov_14.964682_17_plen_46_part_00